jgi:hypothetical protein
MPPAAFGALSPPNQDPGFFAKSAGTLSRSGAHVCVLLCRFML